MYDIKGIVRRILKKIRTGKLTDPVCPECGKRMQRGDDPALKYYFCGDHFEVTLESEDDRPNPEELFDEYVNKHFKDDGDDR